MYSQVHQQCIQFWIIQLYSWRLKSPSPYYITIAFKIQFLFRRFILCGGFYFRLPAIAVIFTELFLFAQGKAKFADASKVKCWYHFLYIYIHCLYTFIFIVSPNAMLTQKTLAESRPARDIKSTTQNTPSANIFPRHLFPYEPLFHPSI
jgi:hypothetical protein